MSDLHLFSASFLGVLGGSHLKSKVILLLLCIMLLIVLCVCCNLSTRWPAPAIEITEVRSDWGDILYDADGSYHGFIELYNNSDQAVCLDGWYLSDSTTNLKKYQITQCTISPYSYAIFWSNDAEDVSNLSVSGYFLGYSLQKEEPILLVNPSGRIIDSVTLPALEKGMAYAKGATGLWSTRAATPGSASTTAVSFDSTIVSAPTLSAPSGFYEGSLDLDIYASAGLTVYYTLDGSTPTTESLQYEGPLHLTDATSQENRYSMLTNVSSFEDVYTPNYPIPKIHVIRAIAVDSTGHISDEVSASYFIDYENRYGFEDVMMLSIITDPDNLFGDELGIYVLGDIGEANLAMADTSIANWSVKVPSNYTFSGKGWRRPVQLELFDSQHQLVATQDAGISIHGGWSVHHIQKSFNLYATQEADGTQVIFPGVFDSSSSSVMLRAGGFRDLYSTKIRDILNNNLVADRSVTVLDSVPCQVFINGEYWGLYNLQERISDGLLTSSYNVNENNLVVLKGYVVTGEPEDYALYSDILSFVTKNDMSLDENYAQVCEWIDVQSYIDYYCFQIYVANCDSVANNYGLWRTRYAVDDEYGDGKWRWILYDTDDSLGMVEGRTNLEADSFTDGHWSVDPLDDALFGSLMKNETFKLQFAKTFEEMAANNFSVANTNAEIDRLTQIYMPAAVVSHHRFLDESFTEEDYLEHIQVIKDFFAQRYTYIHQHMVNDLGLEEYGY